MATTKKKTIIFIIFVIVILCLIGSGVAMATSASQRQEGSIFNIQAENWTDESSPMIAHIQGTTTEQEQVDFYHAFTQSGEKTIELVDGDYALTWVSAINKDGSIYNVPDKIEFKVENGTYVSESNFNYVSAGKVTSTDMNKVLDEIKEAVKKGDESLTGVNAKQVVEQASTNAKVNPNVDKKQIEQKQQEAEKVAVEKKEATYTGTRPSYTSSSSTTSGNSDSSSSSSTPASSDRGSSSGGSTPTHTHNWVAQTAQVYHPAVYENEEYEYCNGCNSDISHLGSSDEAIAEHMKQHMLNGERGSWVSKFRDVEVQSAYYETVVEGYSCSCGAYRSA